MSCEQKPDPIKQSAIEILAAFNAAKSAHEHLKAPGAIKWIDRLPTDENLKHIVAALENQQITKEQAFEIIKIRVEEMKKNAAVGKPSMYGLLNLTSMWSEYWLTIYKKKIPKPKTAQPESRQPTVTPPTNEELLAGRKALEEELQQTEAADKKDMLKRCLHAFDLSLAEKKIQPERLDAITPLQEEDPQIRPGLANVIDKLKQKMSLPKE